MDTRTVPWLSTSTGTISGRSHVALRRNGQDAWAFWAQGNFACAVVSDGCGAGSRSELGALLSANLMSTATLSSLLAGATFEDALLQGMSATLEGLTRIALGAAPESARNAFVREHLLATLIAVAVGPAGGALLTLGDGWWMLDEDVACMDEGNAPSYLGYALLGQPPRPQLIPVGDASTIAIATDGFDLDSLRSLTASHRSDLTRDLRILQQKGAFDDDASIVCLRRTAPESVTASETDRRPS